MTNDLARAAMALADVLADESRALAASDLRTAAGLLARKREAADAFARAHGEATPDAARRAREALARLRDTARANHVSLERAIAIQGRVIEIVARALPRAEGRGPIAYGANGAFAARRVAPVSMSARI